LKMPRCCRVPRTASFLRWRRVGLRGFGRIVIAAIDDAKVVSLVEKLVLFKLPSVGFGNCTRSAGELRR
jgi:hypothetical protein